MRISLWGGADVARVEQVVERTAAAASLGFERVWFPQTTSVDAMCALAVAAAQVPDIALGTAVVPIQGRHPIPLAQQALTVADAAGPGRFTLGIGVTHPMVSEGWYGIPYRGIVEHCREVLAALEGLLSPDRSVDLVGNRLTARVALTVPADPPEVVLAALGPRMLHLAGRHTAGTVTWMTGVRTLGAQVVPALRAAAETAGRPTPQVIVGLPVCVTDDVAGARQRIAPAMAGAAQMPSYQRMVAAEGVAEPVDLAVIGPEDHVTEQLGALAGAGATELLANVSGEPEERLRTLELLGRVRVS